MIWGRRRPQRATSPNEGVDEARAAKERAEETLRQVQAQWPVVREVADALRRYQQANHFAAAVRAALRGD